MIKDNPPKIVIIGFGFLMGYLYPCYSRLYSEKEMENCIIAVTADEATLEEKRAKYDFPILLHDNMGALQTLYPDIILFAPPPSVAPALTESVLVPYFQQLRTEKKPLPDLYVFPPSPQGNYYIQMLGQDIHVCNILPNMVSQINGISLEGKEGNTHITIPDGHPWPQENLARLQSFFAPLGGVVAVKPEHVLQMLAALCVAEVIPLVLFDIEDALRQRSIKLNSNELAQGMRRLFQQEWKYCPGGIPVEELNISDEIKNTLAEVARAWNVGTIRYLVSCGMEEETARKILVENFDLKLHSAQMQDRQRTEQELRDHATKGGVAEKSRKCYELLIRQRLIQHIVSPGADEEKWAQWLEDICVEIASIVFGHSQSMSRGKPTGCFSAKHHAMLYGFLVRNILRNYGDAGKEYVLRATHLYANQRGSRMAQRAEKNGDEKTMIHYMAYGEWSPDPGTMEKEDVALIPCVETHVYRCPWYDTWQRYGFLEEGKFYCSCIDYQLVKGFNTLLELDVKQVRTLGDPICQFLWNGACLDSAGQKQLRQVSEKLGSSCRKDWIFHTQHVYGSFREILQKVPGGQSVLNQSIQDFAVLFDATDTAVVLNGAEYDYYSID